MVQNYNGKKYKEVTLEASDVNLARRQMGAYINPSTGAIKTTKSKWQSSHIRIIK